MQLSTTACRVHAGFMTIHSVTPPCRLTDALDRTVNLMIMIVKARSRVPVTYSPPGTLSSLLIVQ
jgi:hypothetical protein